jgi:CubicO group peptidase (beta-lactamase class C family)
MPKALQQGELKFWGELCSYIDHVRDKLGVPGVAVAVVGGATGARGPFLGEKCAGVRTLAAPGLAVDRDTVFQLASVSKPITTTILAGLTAPAGGKLKWLDKVPVAWRDHAPTFDQLLSHRSGLSDHAGDKLEDQGHGRDEVLEAIRKLPREPEPAPHAYTNFGFTAAAVAAAAAAGATWEALAQSFFQRARMTQTSARYDDFVGRPNRASVHRRGADGTWHVGGEERNPDAQSPAGGVSSTIVDLTQWMRLWLGIDLDPADQKYHQYLTAILPATMPAPKMYSLGWNMQADNRGFLERLGHSGAFALGAATCVSLFPQDKFGIVALTNGEPLGAPEAICAAFELLRHRPELTARDLETRTDLDPQTHGETLLDVIVEAMRAELHPPPRFRYQKSDKPVKDPGHHAGVYRNDIYGPITFSMTAGGLEMRQHQRVYSLTPTDKADVFVYDSAGENGTPDNGVTFPATSFAPTVRIDDLVFSYPQGLAVIDRPNVDTSAGVEIAFVDRPITMIGPVRVLRVYAKRPGSLRVRLYDEEYRVLAETEKLNIDRAGFHQVVLPKAMQVSKRCYFGFVQPENGVIAYTPPAAGARVMILAADGAALRQPDSRAYSIQVDVDFGNTFERERS